ncbi:MAG: hypothetical protein ACR2IK_04960 [Chloroflexota bacterium]
MHCRRMVLLLPMLLITACARFAPRPLDHVASMPPAASPGLRDVRNRLDIHYHLNAPARLSSRIVASDATQWLIHADAPRPTPGDYVLQFDGTVPGPGPNERRVLPDGDYHVMPDVQSCDQVQQERVPMRIRGADTSTPSITGLTLLPDHISPNFDARDDVTHMTFQVAEDARVSVFLDQAAPAGVLRRIWMGEETRVAAGEQTATWDGTANGQPVANGDYLLGIRARDQAGNVVETAQPLVVQDAGVPDASIASAHIGPLQIIRGGQVCLEVVVRNSGQTLLRTEGPDPGYVYDSFDSYASIENHRFAEHAGFWRIGVNWSASTDTNGATYPYRWGFGHDLQPGEDVAVSGCVTVHNEQDRLVYFAGLIQENVAIHSPGAGLVRVAISS